MQTLLYSLFYYVCTNFGLVDIIQLMIDRNFLKFHAFALHNWRWSFFTWLSCSRMGSCYLTFFFRYLTPPVDGTGETKKILNFNFNWYYFELRTYLVLILKIIFSSSLVRCLCIISKGSTLYLTWYSYWFCNINRLRLMACALLPLCYHWNFNPFGFPEWCTSI